MSAPVAGASPPGTHAKRIECGADSLILVQTPAGTFCYTNRCPHRGTELDWLPGRFVDPESGLLRCATHGALFLPETGECIAGPCLGECLQPAPAPGR